MFRRAHTPLVEITQRKEKGKSTDWKEKTHRGRAIERSFAEKWRESEWEAEKERKRKCEQIEGWRSVKDGERETHTQQRKKRESTKNCYFKKSRDVFVICAHAGYYGINVFVHSSFPAENICYSICLKIHRIFQRLNGLARTMYFSKHSQNFSSNPILLDRYNKHIVLFFFFFSHEYSTCYDFQKQVKKKTFFQSLAINAHEKSTFNKEAMRKKIVQILTRAEGEQPTALRLKKKRGIEAKGNGARGKVACCSRSFVSRMEGEKCARRVLTRGFRLCKDDEEEKKRGESRER